MLIVFSGLPGTGKTTLAQHLARRTGAVYLRIDVIEQALRDAGVAVGASGYGVANQLALSNLRLGHTVLADCVNPVRESRAAWQATADAAGVALLNVQVLCSDTQEHQRRVETRTGDIPGLVPPTWQSVLEHEYEPWNPAPLTLDTAQVSTAQAVATLAGYISKQTPFPLATPTQPARDPR